MKQGIISVLDSMKKGKQWPEPHLQSHWLCRGRKALPLVAQPGPQEELAAGDVLSLWSSGWTGLSRSDPLEKHNLK